MICCYFDANKGNTLLDSERNMEQQFEPQFPYIEEIGNLQGRTTPLPPPLPWYLLLMLQLIPASTLDVPLKILMVEHVHLGTYFWKMSILIQKKNPAIKSMMN